MPIVSCQELLLPKKSTNDGETLQLEPLLQLYKPPGMLANSDPLHSYTCISNPTLQQGLSISAVRTPFSVTAAIVRDLPSSTSFFPDYVNFSFVKIELSTEYKVNGRVATHHPTAYKLEGLVQKQTGSDVWLSRYLPEGSSATGIQGPVGRTQAAS